MRPKQAQAVEDDDNRAAFVADDADGEINFFCQSERQSLPIKREGSGPEGGKLCSAVRSTCPLLAENCQQCDLSAPT